MNKQLKMVRLENLLNSTEELCSISNNQDINTDLILMMCGKKIGGGQFRDVYGFNIDPDRWVIKMETSNTSCNIAEYLLWDEIQGLKGSLAWVKEWFAPIQWVSPNGRILIMERTKEEPKTKGKLRPKKVPDFFMDVKWDNFGWIGDRFVCHDYGFINRFIKYGKKFKAINW